MRDDDFPMPVKELLAKRVAQRCSNPGCGHPTSGPQADPSKAVNVGVASHITAASPCGPRYDPTMAPAHRRSADNGIWLCQTCAKLVDNDELRYPVMKVREWRAHAEAMAARDLARRGGAPPEKFARLERLMPELLAEMRDDLKSSPFMREFVVYKKGLSFWNDGTAYEYTSADEPTLLSKIQIMENVGLVRDITNKNVKRYRL